MTTKSTPTLRRWLEQGPFTLTMSSGFFGFFAHAGVLMTLQEEGLLPSAVSGSSAGALVTALWAAGVPPKEIVEELLRLDRAAFWDPAVGFGLLRGTLFRGLLERALPVRTFEECRVPARVSVFDVGSLSTRSIDSGELAPAIQASCSVPLLFHPLRHEGRLLYDGGILDRPGLAGVPLAERVLYHHLTSRVPVAQGALGRAMPRREGMVGLVIEGLPRCDPFRLGEGQRAVEGAARGTRRALDCLIVGDRVRC